MVAESLTQTPVPLCWTLLVFAQWDNRANEALLAPHKSAGAAKRWINCLYLDALLRILRSERRGDRKWRTSAFLSLFPIRGSAAFGSHCTEYNIQICKVLQKEPDPQLFTTLGLFCSCSWSSLLAWTLAHLPHSCIQEKNFTLKHYVFFTEKSLLTWAWVPDYLSTCAFPTWSIADLRSDKTGENITAVLC